MNASHSPAANPWLDSASRYGRISRLLHWTMACLFAWQFAGMILKNALGLHPRDSWIITTHPQVGFMLMTLLVVRVLWALLNIQRRPTHGTGWLARCASAGHLVIYLLMLIAPLIALLRAWASGRGFTLFNAIPIFPAGEAHPAIAQLINSTRDSLGFSVHGLLSWLLLVVIVGHITMVVLHQWYWRDGTLNKMLGKPPADPL